MSDFEELPKRLLKELDNMSGRWIKDLQQLPQHWFDIIQEEMGKWTQDLLKDALNPARMMEFLRGVGVDPSRLAGMMGQHPGFDPYQVLGLDRTASDEEVKKRYRELLHRIHPDTAGIEGTNFLTQMVLAAFEMIKRERGWS